MVLHRLYRPQAMHKAILTGCPLPRSPHLQALCAHGPAACHSLAVPGSDAALAPPAPGDLCPLMHIACAGQNEVQQQQQLFYAPWVQPSSGQSNLCCHLEPSRCTAAASSAALLQACSPRQQHRGSCHTQIAAQICSASTFPHARTSHSTADRKHPDTFKRLLPS